VHNLASQRTRRPMLLPSPEGADEAGIERAGRHVPCGEVLVRLLPTDIEQPIREYVDETVLEPTHGAIGVELRSARVFDNLRFDDNAPLRQYQFAHDIRSPFSHPCKAYVGLWTSESQSRDSGELSTAESGSKPRNFNDNLKCPPNGQNPAPPPSGTGLRANAGGGEAPRWQTVSELRWGNYPPGFSVAGHGAEESPAPNLELRCVAGARCAAREGRSGSAPRSLETHIHHVKSLGAGASDSSALSLPVSFRRMADQRGALLPARVATAAGGAQLLKHAGRYFSDSAPTPVVEKNNLTQFRNSISQSVARNSDIGRGVTGRWTMKNGYLIQ
jgi:hypothetical protein